MGGVEISGPAARNQGVTEGAARFLDVVFGDVVTVPVDKQLFAVVAVGMVSFMTGNIADVYVVNPFRKSDFAKLFQGLDRCGGQPA